MTQKPNPSLLMHVPGAYHTHDLVTVSQHIAAQLADLGVAGVEVKLRIKGYDVAGNQMVFRCGGQPIAELNLNIDPQAFERPVLPSSTIDAVRADQANDPKPQRKRKKRLSRSHRPKGMIGF